MEYFLFLKIQLGFFLYSISAANSFISGHARFDNGLICCEKELSI
tara:strand:+ start:6158 stop:6292 length:135 start_codon:yes stop_codon:yes gene_type:complete